MSSESLGHKNLKRRVLGHFMDVCRRSVMVSQTARSLEMMIKKNRLSGCFTQWKRSAKLTSVFHSLTTFAQENCVMIGSQTTPIPIKCTYSQILV